jgi:hypothetical protein
MGIKVPFDCSFFASQGSKHALLQVLLCVPLKALRLEPQTTKVPPAVCPGTAAASLQALPL